MMEILAAIVLVMLGIAALRGLLAGLALLLRAVVRLGGVALIVGVIWTVLQLLA